MINKGHYHYNAAEIKSILKTAVVLCDTREQENGHILTALDDLGISYKAITLRFGDYSVMLPAMPEAGINRDVYFDNEIMVERKANLDELAGNFTTSRERFKDEMLRAGNARKYLIIEQGGGYSAILNKQYRCKLSEKSFFASLLSFQARYGLNVVFCGAGMTALFVWNLLYYHVRAWLLGEG